MQLSSAAGLQRKRAEQPSRTHFRKYFLAAVGHTGFTRGPQRCRWRPWEEAVYAIFLLRVLLLSLTVWGLEALGWPGEVTGLGKSHRLLHKLTACHPRRLEGKRMRDP